jgi:hypothetical protein
LAAGLTGGGALLLLTCVFGVWLSIPLTRGIGGVSLTLILGMPLLLGWGWLFGLLLGAAGGAIGGAIGGRSRKRLPSAMAGGLVSFLIYAAFFRLVLSAMTAGYTPPSGYEILNSLALVLGLIGLVPGAIAGSSGASSVQEPQR